MTEGEPLDDREWFVRENAVALLQERDEVIRRQRRRLAQLERSVASLKRQIRGDGANLKRRWLRDPSCHWCLISTQLPASRTPRGGPSDFVASLDHLISRKNGGGRKGVATVLACYHCNFQRNNAEQKGRALTVERNGFRLAFLPDGQVERYPL